MNVTVARYTVGVAALLVLCASLGVAAISLRRRYFRGWSGALARLAEVVIGLALLIAILEILGTIGLFRLIPIVIAALLVGGVTWRAMGRPRAARPRAARVRGSGATTALVGIALLLAAAVVAEWSSPSLQSYDVGIHTFDSLWYHLPWAATFAQSGHITPLHFTDVEYLTAFYPATAELLHALGITLLARDTLSPAINLVWLALLLLAAWCVGRPRRLGALTLAGAALAMATPMMNFSQAGSAANDVVGVFFLIAAVALLANAERRRAAYVVAGVAAGLAVAVKLSLVAPVLALTIGAVAIAPRGRRWSAAALWGLPLVLAGGFWYVRNLIAVGNPFPWTSLGILPTPAPPLQQHTGYSIAHYLINGSLWSRFFEPGLASGLGRWWFLILAAAVIGPLLCVLAGPGRTVRMLGLVALVSLAAYLVTPETAAGPAGDPSGFAFNLRYAAPVLTLSLVVLPLGLPLRSPRRQLALMVAIVAALVATVWKAPLWPGAHVAGAILVGVVFLALAMGLRSAPRVLVAAGVVLLLVAGVIAGYPWQRHYLRERYAFQPGVSYLARAWALFRTVHHARVGLVGTFGGFFSYPLYGLDDSNRVQYIGHHGPHGSLTPIATCTEWRDALNAGHFRYLVTTPARDPWQPKRLSVSPEAAWTASDPAARVLYRRRAAGQQITVFELFGPLDAAGCEHLAS